MKHLFTYNWQIRDQWFSLLEPLPVRTLIKKRTGGRGSISHTLFHIIQVEYNWMAHLLELDFFEEDPGAYRSICSLRQLSQLLHRPIAAFLNDYTEETGRLSIDVVQEDGTRQVTTYRQVLNHLILHEAHHSGQLSVWARELQLQPVAADYLGHARREQELMLSA